MKIPKNLKIAGHNYRVDSVHHIGNYKFAADVNHDAHMMRLARHASPNDRKSQEEMELNLIHELLHAVSCRYLPSRLRLKEDQVQQISEGLYQVLKDNKIRF